MYEHEYSNTSRSQPIFKKSNVRSKYTPHTGNKQTTKAAKKG